MKKGKASIASIAKASGVSTATVSRILQNQPGHAPATVQRVRSLAEKLGYVSDPVVSKLKRQIRSQHRHRFCGTLAFLTSHPTREGWKANKNWVQYYEGAAHRALKLGYRVEAFWAREPGLSGKRCAEILKARGIHGLLIAPTTRPLAHISLPWRDFSAVALGFTMPGVHLDHVSVWHQHSMMLALRQVDKLGYRRIGVIMEKGSDTFSHQAFSAALLQFQSRIDPRDRVPLNLKPDKSEMRAWIKRERLEVVVGFEFIRLWLVESKVSVPRDVSFVSLGLTDQGGQVAGIDERSF